MIMIWMLSVNVELKNLDFVAVYFAKGCALLSNHFLHLHHTFQKLLEAHCASHFSLIFHLFFIHQNTIYLSILVRAVRLLLASGVHLLHENNPDPGQHRVDHHQRDAEAHPAGIGERRDALPVGAVQHVEHDQVGRAAGDDAGATDVGGVGDGEEEKVASHLRAL